jgi:hypothetical protein
LGSDSRTTPNAADLLPRLIEVAPEILAGEDWVPTKRRILEAMSPQR